MGAILALTALTAAAIALSAAARLELRAARRGVDQVRREAALRGGVNRGIALLEEGRQDPEKLLGTLRDYADLRWAPLSPEMEPEGPALQVAVQIVDASARLNLNTADQEQLGKLPGMDRDTASAILAWRDEQNRADDSAYLEGPRPYLTKRRPFDTLEELLMVREVDAAEFFGAPTVAEARVLGRTPLSEFLTPFSGENNADAAGKRRADVNRATVEELLAAANRNEQIVSQAQAQGLIRKREQNEQQGQSYRSVVEAIQAAGVAQEHWGPLLDTWTVDRRSFLPGRVNVNTAPAEVLETLPGMTPEIASSLLAERSRRPGGLGWADLLNVLGSGSPGHADSRGQSQQDLTAVERLLCVRSAAYFVRCLVREGASRRTDAAAAVVYLPAAVDEPAWIVQWRRPDRFPGWTAWYRHPAGEEYSQRGG